MPSSSSWNEEGSSSRRAGQSLHEERRHAITPTNQKTVRRTFTNKTSLPIEVGGVLESANSPTTTMARLGITPPDVATSSPTCISRNGSSSCYSPSSFTSSPTSPRYTRYRNKLANRVQTPYQGKSILLEGQVRSDRKNGDISDMDPVIFSMDHRSDNSDSSSTTSGDTSHPREITMAPDSSPRPGNNNSRVHHRTAALPAVPPIGDNLHQRAYQYRLDENPEPFCFQDAINASHQNETWLVLVDSSDMEASIDTEYTAANQMSAPIYKLESPYSPYTPLSDQSDDDDDEEEEESIPKGPGRKYLQVLHNKARVPLAPTPPRNRSLAPMVQTNRPILVSPENDSDSEMSQYTTSILDIPSPVQITREGLVVFATNHPASTYNQNNNNSSSMGNADVPLPFFAHADDNKWSIWVWGVMLLCLALLLLGLLLVFVFVVPIHWSFGSRQNSMSINDNLLDRISSNPTVSPVIWLAKFPTYSPSLDASPMVPTKTPMPPGETMLLQPTMFPATTLTLAPSSDPVKVHRLGEALTLMATWGHLGLWDVPDTPQYKALDWWIRNVDWDSYSEARKIQRYALAVVYYALNGPGWAESTGWLTDNHECSWYTSSSLDICAGDGIFDHDSLHLLHLTQNGLQGSLPDEIALLTGLSQIRLDANEISGNLPASWSSLRNLRVLILRNNHLKASSLPDELASLTRLEVLDLSENQLSGPLPNFVAEYRRMAYLMLAENDFSGPLPLAYAGLANLRVLSLEGNHLTGGVPESYGQGLAQLRELRLGNNLLSEWNPDGWEFPLLALLDLSQNEFRGNIPDILFDLTTLTSLNLAKNDISGEIPLQIGNLLLLEELNLADNELDGAIPSSLGRIRDIRGLLLQRNQLSGVLPQNLRRLRRLERFRVDGNRLREVDQVCTGLVDTLNEFYADCAPAIGLRCSCCTHCCDLQGVCVELPI